jgi:hypothetical protein
LAVIAWTICSGSLLARPAPGSSSGIRTTTARGPPSHHGLGVGGRVDHMMADDVVAQP